METPEPPKPKRKGLIVGGIIALLMVVGIANAHSPTRDTTSSSKPATSTTSSIPTEAVDSTTTPETTPIETPAPVPTPVAAPTPAPQPKTCSSGYYLNVDGNCIQSPTAAPSAPAGATAICRDGTYSFSQNHSGTCSHHGGVASWL